ncbi:hypothetical protein D3C85_1415810 [compost metagenome]
MVAQRVLSLAQAMNPAIQFDDQPEFRTQKVRHIAGDRRLTTKFPPLETAIAKQRPEVGFSRSELFAKATSATCSVWRLVHPVLTPPHPSRSASHLLPRGEKGDPTYGTRRRSSRGSGRSGWR